MGKRIAERWNRCDDYGRFISFFDLDNALAYRGLLTPLSEFTEERYETYCAKCKPENKTGLRLTNEGSFSLITTER